MNRLSHFLLGVACALILPGIALAQTTPTTNPPIPPESPRAHPPGEPDNNNTQVAPVEVPPVTNPPAPAAERRELNFAEADVDKDGRLSLTEYSTFVESRLATLSTQAVSEETIERFRQLDQDKDAFLSETEARSTPPQPAAPRTPPTVPPRR